MLQAKLLSMAAALRRREEVEHSERIKTRQHHLFFLESWTHTIVAENPVAGDKEETKSQDSTFGIGNIDHSTVQLKPGVTRYK